MNEDFQFIEEYRNKGAIFDANLLLVYVVGKRREEYLARSKRTNSYSKQDFDLLEWLMETVFRRVYTTPNVLTEVSNLGPNDPDFFKTLKTVIQILDEKHTASKMAVEDNSFTQLGLTDSGLLALGKEFLIVTADLPLYLTLRSRNIPAVNFTHIRPLSMIT